MEFPTHHDNDDGEGQVVPPTLIQPNNRKSPYWVHYQRYDPIVHPNKVKIAVCNFCSKEISVKQGTGGLKSHLKSKHHDVYIAMGLLTAAASTENDPEQQQQPQQQGAAAAAAAAASASASGTTNTIRTTPQRRQQRQGRAVVPSETDASITSIHNEERRKHEKHLMEMWSYTRKEIHALRQELKNHTTNDDAEDDEEEDNEDQRQELENDIRRLTKRKAEYAAQLGFDE